MFSSSVELSSVVRLAILLAIKIPTPPPDLSFLFFSYPFVSFDVDFGATTSFSFLVVGFHLLHEVLERPVHFSFFILLPVGSSVGWASLSFVGWAWMSFGSRGGATFSIMSFVAGVGLVVAASPCWVVVWCEWAPWLVFASFVPCLWTLGALVVSCVGVISRASVFWGVLCLLGGISLLAVLCLVWGGGGSFGASLSPGWGGGGGGGLCWGFYAIFFYSSLGLLCLYGLLRWLLWCFLYWGL